MSVMRTNLPILISALRCYRDAVEKMEDGDCRLHLARRALWGSWPSWHPAEALDPREELPKELGESDLPAGLKLRLYELHDLGPGVRVAKLLSLIEECVRLAGEGTGQFRVPDGPYAVGSFGWSGEPYPVANLRWHLISCLWNKCAVPVEEVLQEVYGGDEKESALKKLQHDTNDWFLTREPHRLPWEIITPMTGHLELRKFAEN